MSLRQRNAMTATLLMTSILLGSLASAADQANSEQKKQKKVRKPNPVMQPIEDDPSLPRVLLLGDSISIGYTLAVRELLADKANVHRAPTNCGPTTRGIESIDEWLGEKPWDVIHFNWGLHDLKYLGPQGQNLADPAESDSRQQVPPDQYRANLQKLVDRMKRTGAKLIWCSTTPVPEGAKGRIVGDAVKYNEIAAAVMKEKGVAIDDLYGAAKPRLKAIQLPANVHFTAEGSKELAKTVAQAITEALP